MEEGAMKGHDRDARWGDGNHEGDMGAGRRERQGTQAKHNDKEVR